MTDNRTNEPTPEQVEAAAKALYANKTGSERGFEHTLFRRTWLQSARIALVAAQGAAPQAGHNDLIAKTFNEIHGDRRSFSHAEVKQIVYPLIDALRAPVLPSSGVDEDALAEVILAAEYAHRYAEFRGDRDIGTLAHYQARAVAEFLTAPQKEAVKWEYREKISTYPDGSPCVGMQVADDHVKDLGFEGRKIVRRRVGEWEEVEK